MRWVVDRVVADKWAGVLCDEEEVQPLSLDELSRAVEALDAKTRTMVTVFGVDNSYLCTGGGSGRYVAYVSASDGQLWNLLLDDERKGVILLNVGGQEGDFPARQVLDKSHVLQAGRTFFETGTLDPALRWEKQL